MLTQKEPVLRMKNVTKEFPGVKALDKVNFNIYQGKVMGLLGENGAGKSTLMKILAGIYPTSSGDIFYRESKVQVDSPRKAQELGIAIIHQELNLVPEFTAAENIFLGSNPIKSLGNINWKKLYADAEKLLERLNLAGLSRKLVKDMSIAEQQMVEIAKALSLNAEIIIMDEPTDALTSTETESLFKVIRKLKSEHKCVVYISHKLNEISQVCDDVTILRDGNLISECEISKINEDAMIELMVGRSLSEQFPKIESALGEVVLKVKNLTNKWVTDISFNLRKGEVLGISGLMGSGRTELAKTIFGAYSTNFGVIEIEGNEIKIRSPQKSIESGIVYISEDRKNDGLVLGMSVKENLSLSSLNQISTTWGHLLNRKEIDIAEEFIKTMSIKTPSLNQEIKKLSGGNQQKVSIAKGLMTHPKILILDEPTRGVDVGARKELYTLINQFKLESMGIILVSSEIPEIIGMCDRVLVMHEGKIKGELKSSQITQDNIMRLAVGIAEVHS
ncbi:MAG: ribose ABC transporter ATP-binding protein RbsA [Alkaliphilus sp.]